jgi:hypothetical protein
VSEASAQFPASRAALYVAVADADAAMTKAEQAGADKKWMQRTCPTVTGRAVFEIRRETFGGFPND